MRTVSVAKLNSVLSPDSHCVLNPQRDEVAVKLLFNVSCGAKDAEYIEIYTSSRCGRRGARLHFNIRESENMCVEKGK